MKLRQKIIRTSLALLTLSCIQVAQAGEQGHYTPGSWSPRDLIAAPSGMKAVALYMNFYDAGKARTGQGELVDESTGVDVGANSWMFTPVVVYAPSVKILGADWSTVIVPAFGESGANARLTAFEQDIPLFDNNNLGFGDLYTIPANLTWHLNSMWALSAQYAFWAPIGEYSPSRSDNVGLGYWSHDMRGTVSFFPLGHPGTLLSASVLYEVNSRKQGYDLRPAPHTTVELGVSQAFSERFMVGVMSGGVWETGDASGSDAAEDGRDRMVNASVEATYWFVLGKLGAMSRITRELHVRDRFQGTTFTMGVNVLL
jgi:hypothetical protein